MTKIRRGNFVFVTYSGDHKPRHVHVYRDGRLVVKWDLDHSIEMWGHATRRIRLLIGELEQEDLL